MDLVACVSILSGAPVQHSVTGSPVALQSVQFGANGLHLEAHLGTTHKHSSMSSKPVLSSLLFQMTLNSTRVPLFGYDISYDSCNSVRTKQSKCSCICAPQYRYWYSCFCQLSCAFETGLRRATSSCSWRSQPRVARPRSTWEQLLPAVGPG